MDLRGTKCEPAHKLDAQRAGIMAFAPHHRRHPGPQLWHGADRHGGPRYREHAGRGPLHLLTLPLTILTLGLFWLVVNAFLLKLASVFVPGFSVQGFVPAFLGSIVFTVLHYILHHVFFYSNAGLF
jgi:hypothetical protein